MTKEEEIIKLFGFISKLIAEPETKGVKETNPTPVDKVDNTLSENIFGKIEDANFDADSIKRMQDLIKYTSDTDEKKYKDMGVQRIVQQTIRPILDQLKKTAADEHISDFAERTGVTFDKETGKLIEVDVPPIITESEVTPDLVDAANSGIPEPISSEVTMQEALADNGIPTDKGIERPILNITDIKNQNKPNN